MKPSRMADGLLCGTAVSERLLSKDNLGGPGAQSQQVDSLSKA